MSLHVQLYLNQVETLMSVNLNDHRVYEQLKAENMDLIDKHNSSLGGLLEEVLLPSGARFTKNRSDASSGIEAWARRVNRETIELFDEILPNRDKEWPYMYPGVESYNVKEKTLNVQVTERNFLENKTQQMKMGKYLRRLDRYTDTEINNYANAFKSALTIIENAELSLARGSDEIMDVYKHGPNSCMSGDIWSCDTNPMQVYGTADIACAYVEIAGDIKARAMVNLIDDSYSTIYGNGALLEPLLEKAGYDPGNLDGCRIFKIPISDTYLMPYIDDAQGVSECSDPEYFIVGGYDHNCCSTEGTCDDGIMCPACEDRFDPEYDGVWVEAADASYCCESCANEDGFIEAIADTRWAIYEWVSSDDAYYCKSDDQYYTNADGLIEVDGELYRDDDDSVVYSEDQEEYIFLCDAVWISDIDSWVDDDREHEFEPEEDDDYEDIPLTASTA